MARTKDTPRGATEQFNIRMTAEQAEVVRAAIPKGHLTAVTVRLLLAEAKSRLQLDLEDTAA